LHRSYTLSAPERPISPIVDVAPAIPHRIPAWLSASRCSASQSSAQSMQQLKQASLRAVDVLCLRPLERFREPERDLRAPVIDYLRRRQELDAGKFQPPVS
jgi:hypothetical protein